MPAINLRLFFMVLTMATLLGAGAIHATLQKQDYEENARQYIAEIKQLDYANRRTQSPRLVFAGGSSVMYGIDAQLMEQELGVRAINLGLPDALGSEANYIDFLLPRVRSGDIVIYTSIHWWKGTPEERDSRKIAKSRRLADSIWRLGGIDLSERKAADWLWLQPIPDRSLAQQFLRRNDVVTNKFNWKRSAHGNMSNMPCNSLFKPLNAPAQPPAAAVTDRSRSLVVTLANRGIPVVFFETGLYVAERERKRWTRYSKGLNTDLSKAARVLPVSEKLIFVSDQTHFCDAPTHLTATSRREWSQFLANKIRETPEFFAMSSNRAAGN